MRKILVDMNLSPQWVPLLEAAGWEAVHWSNAGAPNASDAEIMAWARARGHVVFTHDLDFGALLAATGALGPSVIQVRTEDLFPEAIGSLVVKALRQFQAELSRGALITIDVARSRARILPFEL